VRRSVDCLIKGGLVLYLVQLMATRCWGRECASRWSPASCCPTAGRWGSRTSSWWLRRAGCPSATIIRA